ncbi:hypothetical protein HDU87_008188 [Geranomyces variabilis]|uniref:Uncharacterized protein n=1 Tax=Geranomyces variabilis TaxID=109894 RepID=A0AAD5TFS1_9FUNG|nr:hypothetical protein HDU87_008188 [Geranomyces variabilis]
MPRQDILGKLRKLGVLQRRQLFNSTDLFTPWLQNLSTSYRAFTQLAAKHPADPIIFEWAGRIKRGKHAQSWQKRLNAEHSELPAGRKVTVISCQHQGPRSAAQPVTPAMFEPLTHYHVNRYQDLEIRDAETGHTVLFASRNVASGAHAVEYQKTIKMLVNHQLPVKRGKSHPSEGSMAAFGMQAGSATNFAAKGVSEYQPKPKYRNVPADSLRVTTEAGQDLAHTILKTAKIFHPQAVAKMEEVAGGKFSGRYPMFVTMDYAAGLHIDDNASEFAIGIATTDGGSDIGWNFLFPEDMTDFRMRQYCNNNLQISNEASAFSIFWDHLFNVIVPKSFKITSTDTPVAASKWRKLQTYKDTRNVQARRSDKGWISSTGQTIAWGEAKKEDEVGNLKEAAHTQMKAIKGAKDCHDFNLRQTGRETKTFATNWLGERLHDPVLLHSL